MISWPELSPIRLKFSVIIATNFGFIMTAKHYNFRSVPRTGFALSGNIAWWNVFACQKSIEPAVTPIWHFVRLCSGVSTYFFAAHIVTIYCRHIVTCIFDKRQFDWCGDIFFLFRISVDIICVRNCYNISCSDDWTWVILTRDKSYFLSFMSEHEESSRRVFEHRGVNVKWFHDSN